MLADQNISKKVSLRPTDIATTFISLFIFIIGAVARWKYLNESIWFDEVWCSRLMLPDMLSTVIGFARVDHMPFFYFIMRVWISLFGDGVIALRLPTLILMSASVPMTYIFCKPLLGKAYAGLVCALVWLSPVHIHYSVEARYYGMGLFILITLLAATQEPFAFLAKRSKVGSCWLVGLMMAGGLLHPYFIVYEAVILIILSLSNETKFFKNYFWMLLTSFGLVLGYMIFRNSLTPFSGVNFGYLKVFTWQEWAKLFFNWYSFGNTFFIDRRQDILYKPQIWVLLIQAFYACLFVFGVVRVFKTDKQYRQPWMLILFCLIFIPLILLLLGYTGKKMFIERSVMMVLPLFFMVVSAGCKFLSHPIARRIAAAFLLLLALASSVIFCVRDEDWTVYKRKPDWYSAHRYLEQQRLENGDSMRIISSIPLLSLQYYDPCFKVYFFNPMLKYCGSRWWVWAVKVGVSKVEFFQAIYNKKNEGFDVACQIHPGKKPIRCDQKIPKKMNERYIYQVEILNWQTAADFQISKRLALNPAYFRDQCREFKNLRITRYRRVS